VKVCSGIAMPRASQRRVVAVFAARRSMPPCVVSPCCLLVYVVCPPSSSSSSLPFLPSPSSLLQVWGSRECEAGEGGEEEDCRRLFFRAPATPRECPSQSRRERRIIRRRAAVCRYRCIRRYIRQSAFSCSICARAYAIGLPFVPLRAEDMMR